MDDLRKQAIVIQSEIKNAFINLNIESKKKELDKLKAESQTPKFWNNTTHAQTVMKQISKIEDQISPWIKIDAAIKELVELSEMGDNTISNELVEQISAIKINLDSLKKDLKFSGFFDDHDAILSIYAGAGGTDAQDWTQMLFRMYARFCEINRWDVAVIEESAGEEAGLKTVTIEVHGSFAYGKLKGEHGVHRLVRLSPFNADNLRQTSFAKVEVVPKIDKPEELVIDEKDLKIDVYRSGGHGGQSVNTTDSAVRITHTPTGISVAIQNERSQLQNKETALTILRSKLAQLQLEQHAKKVDEIKGPNQSAEWGSQIRNYVLHPYKQVKDLRTKYETSDPDSVLDGKLDDLIDAYLDQNISNNQQMV